MIRSCIAVSYLALVGGPGAGIAWLDAARVQDDPDRLYRDREQPASALAAERIWTERLAADGSDFESAWKLARARYWLGTNGPLPAARRKQWLERGIAAARLAAAADPRSPAGPFWMAACMGALADAHGLRQGLRYRGQIRDALETARRLDPTYLDGSPDRALGRWYYKVPGLFGGDLRKSEQHLRVALGYKPDSVISLLFLAETLLALDRDDDARAALDAAIAATPDPEWAPEDRRFQADARTLLATLTNR
ncbi:MAG: TRAP transporter TatT component family protein [Vicinamibacterales bacterium]